MMNKGKYVSAYDALEWARTLQKKGYDKFMLRDLPDELYKPRLARKSLSRGYIKVIGDVRISGTRLHVYEPASDLFNIYHTSRRCVF